MGAPHLNLTGLRFGRLLGVRRSHQDKHHKWVWLFKCDCGVDHLAIGASVRKGDILSCGCLQKEIVSGLHKKHGMAGSLLYLTWRQMHTRCYNPNSQDYKNYGGRGIKVEERWHKFENFLADMGEKPSSELTLDRIDNNLDYGPNNCRWATRLEQQRNKGRAEPLTVEQIKSLQDL